MIARILAATLVLSASPAPVLACTVTLPPLPSRFAAYRVWGFKLAMRHASVTGVGTLPVAWLLRFDNNENFVTAASGNAVVSAAELEFSDVAHRFSVAPEPHYSCADLDRLHVVRLTLTLDPFGGHPMHRLVVAPGTVRIGTQVSGPAR